MERYELFTSKELTLTIEKLIKWEGLDVDHDFYKDIIYGNLPCQNEYDFFIKSLYDGYVYLTINRKNAFTKRMIKRFIYICFGRELDENLINDIQTKFNEPINKSKIEIIVDNYIYFKEIIKEERMSSLISFLILNYLLMHYDYRPIKPTIAKRKMFNDALEKYYIGERKELYTLVLNLSMTETKQSKEYYKKLKVLTLEDIEETLKSEQNILEKVFLVKHISVFGSFIKNKQRLDSDIDLLVMFKEDISYQEKTKKQEELNEYLFKLFDRYIDIYEHNLFLDEIIALEVHNTKLIF